jgi:hypothetical protein
LEVDVPRGQIENAADALRAIMAGNAAITLVSKKTGVRYTYRVRNARTADEKRFVWLLIGSWNEEDLAYIGVLDQTGFRITTGSTVSADAPSVRGFEWAARKLLAGELPETLEIWHEGRCCKCDRPLTTPESVERGLGPKCLTRMRSESR